MRNVVTVGNNEFNLDVMNQISSFLVEVVANNRQEKTQVITLCEKGVYWECDGTPNEIWLLWGLGKVWWTPVSIIRPWWAEILRSQWDPSWQ